jgi:hypothetical protein
MAQAKVRVKKTRQEDQANQIKKKQRAMKKKKRT